MALALRVNNGRACEATTWVCKAPDCNLPFFGTALDEAAMKGMHIGLHLESRSVVVHYAQSRPSQSVQRSLAVVLGKGGSIHKAIENMESFDLYHAESWGLVQLNAPAMPEPDYLDNVVDEDELSEVETEAEVEVPQVDAGPSEASIPDVSELAVLSPDLFALVVQPTAKTVRVPSLNKALDMDTSYQKELREAMEKAGGPLSQDLKKDLFPRGMNHAKDVREEAMAPARKKECIVWITTPPDFITIYGKPKMHQARRVEWIVWKADKLNLELTLPLFMAFFKQSTFYTSSKARLDGYKAAVQQWQGHELDLKELDHNTRNLIMNINEGKADCYCKNCSRVLDPKATTQFCSSSCASYFCSLKNCGIECGKKLKVKMVTDHDQLERLNNRIGPFRQLVELAEMLQYKEEVDACKSRADFNAKFEELTQKRKAENCCQAVEGFMDNRWCKRCLDEFDRINRLGRCFGKICSGVTWGHCEEAARRLKIMREIPLPKMEEKSCDCRPRKKARTV